MTETDVCTRATVSFRETGENGIGGGGGDGGGGGSAAAAIDDGGQARTIKIRYEGTRRRIRWRGDGVRITSVAVCTRSAARRARYRSVARAVNSKHRSHDHYKYICRYVIIRSPSFCCSGFPFFRFAPLTPLHPPPPALIRECMRRARYTIILYSSFIDSARVVQRVSLDV